MHVKWIDLKHSCLCMHILLQLVFKNVCLTNITHIKLSIYIYTKWSGGHQEPKINNIQSQL